MIIEQQPSQGLLQPLVEVVYFDRSQSSLPASANIRPRILPIWFFDVPLTQVYVVSRHV